MAKAWMRMHYQCATCGKIEPVYIEEGLEGGPDPELHGGLNHLPVPFIIRCEECIPDSELGINRFPYGAMEHVRWDLDRIFEPSIEVPAGARYFRLPTIREREQWGEQVCGVPTRAGGRS